MTEVYAVCEIKYEYDDNYYNPDDFNSSQPIVAYKNKQAALEKCIDFNLKDLLSIDPYSYNIQVDIEIIKKYIPKFKEYISIQQYINIRSWEELIDEISQLEYYQKADILNNGFNKHFYELVTLELV